MTCSCEGLEACDEIEFFKGSTVDFEFTVRSATYDRTRGVLIPGDAVNLTGATVVIYIEGAGVSIQKNAVISDQITNLGQITFTIEPADTIGLNGNFTADMEAHYTLATGGEHTSTLSKILIKETVNPND